MTTYTATLTSPIGDIALVGDGEALSGLYMPQHRHRPPLPDSVVRDDAAFDAAREQLGAYFAGERTEFDVPVAATGTPFQQEVWRALAEIPYGRTWSYGELAQHVGKPAAVRAVGLANGRNPVSIVVPCHRVVGADGSLTGYGGGIERKRFLLDLERGAIA
jgi:methylated-DNA-[protein]-cysteine S-methyltransferase